MSNLDNSVIKILWVNNFTKMVIFGAKINPGFFQKIRQNALIYALFLHDLKAPNLEINLLRSKIKDS